jgi:hypothetical protein
MFPEIKCIVAFTSVRIQFFAISSHGDNLTEKYKLKTFEPQLYLGEYCNKVFKGVCSGNSQN